MCSVLIFFSPRCRQEDGIILNSMITEWEYLYCKLLLISKIVDGDDGLMMSRQPSKATGQRSEDPKAASQRCATSPKQKQFVLNFLNDLNGVNYVCCL